MIESRKSKAESRNRGEARGARREVCTFPLPPSAFRLGISLTEVLIAMGIMTVGLLGVASVFPVGSWYMQKAEVADTASAIAQSAMNSIVTQGLLNPHSWFVMSPQLSPQNSTLGDPNYIFAGLDGKYVPRPAGQPPAPKNYTFTRPFAETLASSQSAVASSSQKQYIVSRQMGDAFVIDPLGITAVAQVFNNGMGGPNNQLCDVFPYSAYLNYPGAAPNYYASALWNPWKAGAKQITWPIRRVTFRESATAQHLSKSTAELYFAGMDDLTFDFPQRADRPAIQNWDTGNVGGNQAPLARKWSGDYSWIVTVAPATPEARDGMATNPEGYEYNVSVVVFYKRVLPTGYPTGNPEVIAAAAHEGSFGASILSTGPSGGELLVRDLSGGTNPFNNLKTGQWIMLCGPHPNSTDARPLFVMNWYRVLSIDSTITKAEVAPNDSNFDPARYRIVSVRGPQWPWQPATTPWGYSNLSNDLCVGIFKGAVAVHTKTMRLQSGMAGGAIGMSGDPVTFNQNAFNR